MRTITGLLAQLIITMSVFVVNMLLIGIAGLLRLLPSLLSVMGRIAWAIVLLSCRLYYLSLTRAAPVIRRHIRINVLQGLWRLAATVALSLIVGLVLLLLAQWPITLWTVGPFVLHGLFVDFIWDDIPQTESIQMGVRP